jgi:acetoacetyl-CoA synthetase
MSDQPLWTPPPHRVRNSHLKAFMGVHRRGEDDYAAFWRWSIDHMDQFWDGVWYYTGVIGDKGARVLVHGDKMPGAHFFPDARLNYAENCLRRRDHDAAIIFRDEQGHERMVSYADLYHRVSQLVQVLKSYGVGVGDRVAGVLPNCPEACIAMLAISAIGAVWSSASPDFGVQGLMDRFGQIEPKILITVDGYFYNGKTIDCREKNAAVHAQLPTLAHMLVLNFAGLGVDGDNTSDFDVACDGMVPGDIDFVRLPFNHPLFIMFSSGTTGVPKCIVHAAGGVLLTHLKEHQLQCDIKRGDRVFYFTTCGWMMWNWLMTVLATQATIVIYDGSPFYPNADVLWDFCARHQVTLFGTAAKYIDALRSNGVDVKGRFDLTKLRTLTSTGSPLVHESFDYIYKHIKSDLHVASISGGTDIVSCFVIGNPTSPVWRGEIQGAGLGYAIDVYDDNGQSIAVPDVAGELVCTKPFPSMPIQFWNDADGTKYHKAYFDRFQNIWCHGDWVLKTEHGGLMITGRSDATLKPGGVRIGTAEIYRQVELVPDVVESIAVGQDFDNDVRVILFVRLRDGVMLNDDLTARIKKQIKDGASPRHVPAVIIQVSDIPRTKSGKIVELAVREVIHGRPVKNVEALANADALDLYRNLPQLGAG